MSTNVRDTTPIAQLERILRREQTALDQARMEFEEAEATWKASCEFAAHTIPELEAAISTLRSAA